MRYAQNQFDKSLDLLFSYMLIWKLFLAMQSNRSLILQIGIRRIIKLLLSVKVKEIVNFI
jgi:hypothetical protein